MVLSNLQFGPTQEGKYVYTDWSMTSCRDGFHFQPRNHLTSTCSWTQAVTGQLFSFWIKLELHLSTKRKVRHLARGGLPLAKGPPLYHLSLRKLLTIGIPCLLGSDRGKGKFLRPQQSKTPEVKHIIPSELCQRLEGYIPRSKKSPFPNLAMTMVELRDLL